MKKLYSLLALSLFYSLGKAQVTDVFQNKEYFYSTNVLKAEIEKEYTPNTVEIFQDKNDDKNEIWKNIEDKLYTIAINQLENEVDFFQIHTKAVSYLKQIEEKKIIEDYRYSAQAYNPYFKSIDINLMSVLNAIGLYYIQYNFEEVQVKDYYLADYKRGEVIKIEGNLNTQQQEVLKKLTLSKFTAIYLLQTQKLGLDNVDRIIATQEGRENAPDFSNHIDYSEANVYPYFSGILVEFPANSFSSSIFDNQAFRLFLRGEEVMELLPVFPEFKRAFEKPLVKPSNNIITALNYEENYDISRFNTAPKELKMLEILNLLDADKKLFSLNINSYQKTDTLKRFIGSKKIFFNKNKQIARLEGRNDKEEVVSEETRSYNQKQQLDAIKYSGPSNKLKLNHYNDDLLYYEENVEVSTYRTSYNKENVDLEIIQEHFVYNNTYRHALSLNLVGDFNRHSRMYSRYIDGVDYCTNHFCFLMDENEQVIGVRMKFSSPVDILLNLRNQPVESYFDYDRYHYLFTYDDEHRIETFSAFSGARRLLRIEYTYHQNMEKPVTIIETRNQDSSPTIIIQEYEVSFWED